MESSRPGCTPRKRTPRGETLPAGPDELAVLGEEHRRAIDTLHQLAPRQREVLVLRYWSDMSEEQVATALGIARATVKSTASRGVAVLEARLEEHG